MSRRSLHRAMCQVVVPIVLGASTLRAQASTPTATSVPSATAAPSATQTPRADDSPVCLGFAFGVWTPALNWHAAGHVADIDPRTTQHADDGRDWASTQAVENEHTIVLLPSWWPAGVQVTLPNRAPAFGDTVQGSAFAFVADGRRTAPRAAVRAWRVQCGRRTP